MVHLVLGLLNQVRPSRSEKWTMLPSQQPPRRPLHLVPRSCPKPILSATVRQRVHLPSALGRSLRVAKVHLGSRSVNNSHRRPQAVSSILVKIRLLHPLPLHSGSKMGQSRIVRPHSISHCRSGSGLRLPLQLRTPSLSRIRHLSQRHRPMPPDTLLGSNPQHRRNHQLLYPHFQSRGHRSRLVVPCSILGHHQPFNHRARAPSRSCQLDVAVLDVEHNNLFPRWLICMGRLCCFLTLR